MNLQHTSFVSIQTPPFLYIRLTNLCSNALIGLSILFLGHVLSYIPTAVLDGLFLYLAVTALYGNQVIIQRGSCGWQGSKLPPSLERVRVQSA